MSVRILGPVEAWAQHRRLDLGGRRQLVLFAFLVLHANRAVSRDALIDAVWGSERSSSDNRLSMAIARLRKALEPLNSGGESPLRTVSGGYMLAVEPGELDAEAFADGVSAGRRALEAGHATATSELVGQALALWRGPPLAEVAFEDFAQPEIRRLEEMRLEALEVRADADLELGRHAHLVGELEGLLVQHPARERVAAQLMLALYRSGRQADALDTYQRTRVHLAEELGLEPGPVLKSLQEQILGQAPTVATPGLPARATDSKGWASTVLRLTNLPATVPRLIGRDADVQRVREALVVDGERLVSLTGQGGVGKTSLALVCGEALRDEFPGGVWLVSLAALNSQEEVLPAVEAVLSRELSDLSDSPSGSIATWLRGRGKTLVILDNFEHLLEAAAPLAQLLDAAPELSVLITSQTPLRLSHERVLAIASLDEESALSLIEQVARQRGTRLGEDREHREALRSIVSVLDGLPLTLELAAARLTLLPATRLAERLRESTDLLQEDRRDRPQRHQSLRATVEWTLDSLGGEQRELFVRLGAFAAAVDLEEIEAIAGGDGLDVLAALSGLLDAGLVRRIEVGDLRMRFGLPEALRQIASAMLDGAADGAHWREAHLIRQHDLLWRVRSCAGTAADERAAADADLEAALALHWAQTTGHPLSASVAVTRAGNIIWTGRIREARSMLEPLLDWPPEDPDVRAYAHLVHAWLQSIQGQIDDAIYSTETALALAKDRHIQAAALRTRGHRHSQAKRFDLAVHDHHHAVELARELGPTELAPSLIAESQSRMDCGQLAQAAALLDEAERIAASSEAPGTWPAHTQRGDLALLSDRPAEAVEHYARSLECHDREGQSVQIRLDLIGMADALAMSLRDEAALEVAGIAEALGGDLGTPGGTEWHVQGRDYMREAAERLGEAAEDALARGRGVEANRRVVHACAIARAATIEDTKDQVSR